MRRIILTLNLFLMIFSGCSSKTVYNQGVGVYLPNENDLQKPNLDAKFTDFRNRQMSDFYTFCDKTYSEIEKNNANVETYGMTKLKNRSKIIYHEPKEQQ